MNRLSRWILGFAVAYAVLIIAPALLAGQFPAYPLMKWGDVFDLLTPWVLIPLYWLLYRVDERTPPGTRENLVFLFFAALWAQGQGMHLAANSIGHLLDTQQGSDPQVLTHFYDEVLSHYLWHLGVVGLGALLLWRQWRHPFAGEHSPLVLESMAGVIYGLTYFVSTVEAGTGWLGVPFALIVAGFGLWRGRDHLRAQPLLAFSLVAYGLAAILFLAWAVYWQGFPQFSEVGLLK
jgi:small-conductance mechanosensitive channel